MRFWDSSAIVPLLCIEEASKSMRRLYQEDSDMLVWALTRTEAASALCRRSRDGTLSQKQFSAAKERLRSLRSDWSEVIDYDGVRDRAEARHHINPALGNTDRGLYLCPTLMSGTG